MTKAQFIQNLMSGVQSVTWFDSTGYIKLGDNRIKIELDSTTTSDHFNGIRVQVISKIDGLIDAKVFKFNDYMELVSSERVNNYQRGLVILSYIAWDWYIDKPVSIEPLVRALNNYIDLWR